MNDLNTILWPDVPFDLQKHLVLLCRRGAEAHETYIPPTDPNSIDDRDLVGVVVPPAKYYIGLQKWENAESIKNEWDVVLYEFRKVVNLLMKQNPNVLAMLYLRPEDYLHMTEAGRLLVENRSLFQHRGHAVNAFVGYAHGQLNDMMQFEHKGYMGSKRKALVAKFGYDTKNAGHLIRILRMGLEYITTGEMNVYRPDRDELMSIKCGEWSLHAVREEADRLFVLCKDAKATSPLPTEIDEEAIEQLVMKVLRQSL